MILVSKTSDSTPVWLPNEITEKIVGAASPRGQAKICQTSKAFHELGARILYRTITLDYYVLGRCCHTLSTNPDKAALVRILRVPHGAMSEKNFLLLKTTINSLPRLEELDLQLYTWTPDSKYPEILSECTFPQLQSFSFSLSFPHNEALVTSFLSRHQHLHNVKLYPDFTHVTPIPADTIKLPRLKRFDGPSLYLPFLPQDTPLYAAGISWSLHDKDDLETPITALARSSMGILLNLTCLRRGWNVDLIDTISKQIPTIKALTIRTLPKSSMRAEDKTLHAITDSLSNFTALEYFEYCSAVLGGHKEDQTIMMQWRKVCPSLTHCNLYGTSWLLKDGVWMSLNRVQ